MLTRYNINISSIRTSRRRKHDENNFIYHRSRSFFRYAPPANEYKHPVGGNFKEKWTGIKSGRKKSDLTVINDNYARAPVVTTRVRTTGEQLQKKKQNGRKIFASLPANFHTHRVFAYYVNPFAKESLDFPTRIDNDDLFMS